jgi:hypothetical protein
MDGPSEQNLEVSAAFLEAWNDSKAFVCGVELAGAVVAHDRSSHPFAAVHPSPIPIDGLL